MLVLPIIILSFMLLMLFYSQPLRQFSFLKWMITAASVALLALYCIQLVVPT